ncbi:MAG: hypothetical protein FWE42_06300 [Defluviitaleaceae bacterium]|nr:hypothetical protein [Defluviitaleaceae bacterium]
MKFLFGVLGAVIFAIIAWVAVNALGLENEWLRYAIAGILTFTGWTIAQGIYGKVKAKE